MSAEENRFSFRMPEWLYQWLIATAKERNEKCSTIVREALMAAYREDMVENQEEES